MAQPFELGTPIEVEGQYVSHWEAAGFRCRVRRRGWPSRIIPCQFVDSTGSWIAPPGTPAQPDRLLSQTWQVRVLVTPIERGRFGHKGLFRLKLRVEQWLSVEEVAPR